MERWKKNNPSLRIGDSEEDAIIVSDDEEEVEASPSSGSSYQAPSLAEHIGPVSTGQRASRSSPGYREAREQRRREKSKAEEFEPVRGTHAARKRYSAALIDHFAETDRQVEQALPFLSSSRNVLLLGWGVLRRTARRRTEMLEKVPPMAFSILSPPVARLQSPFRHQGRSLPLRR